MNSPTPAQPHQLIQIWGAVAEVGPGMVKIAGVSELAGVGNEIRIEKPGQTVTGEVLKISGESVTALLYSPCDAVRVGDAAIVDQQGMVEPGDHWLGRVVDYRGRISGETPSGGAQRPLLADPPPAPLRRALGSRLSTGLMAVDTLLPICRGQRIGLFAGSGVGKSTLLGALAGGLAADRVVIALIGERSREVNEFVRTVLPEAALPRTVVVAATANEPAGAKKRAAYCAMAAAEHFRDQGHHVLFLFDSITRFAEAHRETALLAGEPPALNAFPPSTVRVVSELAERSGPGADGMGDITAVYSVLVAGSDFEEPVADMIRGILDGHVVLSREIAERGRYPAIDVLRSVSRSLPRAASPTENALIAECRRLIALYEEVEPMLRANLYAPGKDADADRAIERFSELDAFIASTNSGGEDAAFARLAEILERRGGEEAVASADKAEEKVPARAVAEAASVVQEG